MKRINTLAIIGCENSGSRVLFEYITSRYSECKFIMINTTGLYYRKTFLQSVWKILKEASWIFAFVRMCELLKYLIKGDTIKKKCKQLDIPYVSTNDINSPNTLGILKNSQPDLIVSLYTMQIYKKDILEIPKYGAINSHPSKLPEYRGLEVFFWQLANDEKETSVSVFYLTDKVDVGEVIRQENVPILPHYSMTKLYEMITKVAGQLLVDAIKDIDEDKVKLTKVEGKGTYYPMPTSEAVKRFKKLGKKF